MSMEHDAQVHHWHQGSRLVMSLDPKAVKQVIEILRENADNNHPLSIHLLQILGVEPYASWPTHDLPDA